MISISSSAYARKRHGVKNDDRKRIEDPSNPKSNDWSFWDWLKSLFNRKGNKSNALNNEGDGNSSPIRNGYNGGTSQGRYTTQNTRYNTGYGGYQAGNSGTGGTTKPPHRPRYHGCRRFLKRLLITLLLLFLLVLLANFFDKNSSIKDSISNSVDAIKNKVTNKPYDFIVDKGSIDNYIGKENVKIIPISNGYYEIITDDKSLVIGDIPLGSINIPKPITTVCSESSAYRNINSSGLAYNEFVYDYLSNKQVKDVVIAVLDSGIDTDNKELMGHVAVNSKEKSNFMDDDDNGYSDDIKGVNITASNGKINDVNGHGTHVAGIILQTFPNAQLLPIKVNDGDNDKIDDLNIIKGLRYAIDNNVDIINMSFGGKGDNPVINELIDEAIEKGIIVIAAAGNESQNVKTYYPANSNGVISVGSISTTGSMSSFSNFGADLLLPGECIYSYGINNDMVFMNGTSMAAPHLAGVLGAYLSLGNELGGENDIIQLINNSSRKVGKESLLDITKLLGLGDDSEIINENISSMTGIINNIENNINNIKNNGGKTDSIISKENLNNLLDNASNIMNLYTGLSINTGFAYDMKDLIDNYTSSLKKLHENSVYLTTEGGVLQGSLGLGLKDNKYQILIKSGTTLPAKGSYITSNTISEHSIYLTVYQGDNEYAVRNTQLGKFTFQLANRTPIREAKLRVDFDVNEYGKLSVKAYEPDNPSKPPITPTINGAIQRDNDDFSDENKEIRDIINNIDEQSKNIVLRIDNYYRANPNDYIPEEINGILNNTGAITNNITTQSSGNIQSPEISNQEKSNNNISYNYKVDKVIDGDTIRVFINGESTKVRLIGIDAPESNDTRYGYTECYGQASSNYLTNLLSNKTVGLEYDSSQGRSDKYDRILAYIFLNGENINKKIIEDGYAWEYTYNLPYKYQSDFKQAESSAKQSKKGLWNKNTCNGEHKKGK